jgi:hypothetical protein
VDLNDSDPGVVVGSWLAAMHRLAQAIWYGSVRHEDSPT